jgi:acetyltransferase-like isoleucine patch superfamily enzyme
MSVLTKIRRGEGPVWAKLKSLAKTFLSGHLPVNGVFKTIFRLCYALHVMVREGLIWACRFFWFEPLFRSQCELVGRGFHMEQLPYITGKGRIVIGESVELSGKPSFCFGTASRSTPRLEIGAGTFVGHNSSLVVAELVEIGERCLIAGGVVIRDYDGHPLDAADRRAKCKVRADEIRPVHIGDDVWIGAAATVLKGVRIGDRSVIATRSVVTKDVPPDVVVAGNPARIVKRLTNQTSACE